MGWDFWERKEWRYNYCYFINKNSCTKFLLIVVKRKICNKTKIKFGYKLCNVVKCVTILIILVLILDWNTRFGPERGTSSGTDWVAETKRSVCTSSLMTFFMCIFLRVLFTLWMENVFHCVGSGKLTTFYVGLFIPLRIVPYALSPLWMESWNVTIQMKATERYFPWYCLLRWTSGSNFWVCGSH